MPSRALRITAAVICAAAVFQAAMVFLVNSPTNPVKTALSPVLDRYDGPWLAQGWSLFAPNPPEWNVHVLVRGKAATGVVTGWYDVTLFFLDVVGSNRLNPLRELGEGLGHAAVPSARQAGNAFADPLLDRTAAMVLRLYVKQPLVAEQVELDTWMIPAFGSLEKRTVNVDRWAWEKIPDVSPLRI
jgi:Family of unknown function (DUF5819)